METYNDWLAHHGIPGMKWGERNGPPYPLTPMQYTKEELKEKRKAASGYNKELRKTQNIKYRIADVTKRRKEAARERRLARIENSNKTDEEKQAEFESLERKYNGDRRYQKAVDTVERGNQKVIEILNRAQDEGGLSLKETKTYAIKPYASAAVSVAQVAGGIYANMAVSTIMSMVDHVRIKNGDDPLFLDEGTDKYRVKVDKQYKSKVQENEKSKNSDYGKELKNIYDTAKTDEEKDRRVRELDKKYIKTNSKYEGKNDMNYYSKEQRDSKYERAKEKDLFDLDFLEAVQNYNLPRDVMLKEYRKYVDLDSSFSDYVDELADDHLKKYAE